MFFSDCKAALARQEGLTAYPAVEPCPAHQASAGSPRATAPFSRTVIHDLLESLFQDAGLASLDTGVADPNPLGRLIRPGDTVVLKPNWVMDRNASGQGTGCLITNPAVIVAVLDYVLRASPGKVVVGDAPIQGCNLERLMEEGGYNQIKEQFRRLNAPIDWVDFRRTTLDKSKAIWERKTDLRQQEHYVLFDLGSQSLLEPISGGADRFRVTVYNPDLMRQRHALGKHQYLIAREIVEADVVINLPKLKMHGKAGITGALKNVVGINGNKEFLPHHRAGGADHGGDCYPGASRLKLAGERFLDAANRRSGTANLAFRQFSRVSFKLARSLGEDANMEGSWYGNDTIWRTCLDLNRILYYGCKDGTLAQTPQRRVLTITDAIICGEGNGPLAPTPRPLGMLTCAANPLAADYLHAYLMGLDWTKIPLLREGFNQFSHPIASFCPEEIEVLFGGRSFKQPWPEWNPVPFRPPVGWTGHCERSHPTASASSL